MRVSTLLPVVLIGLAACVVDGVDESPDTSEASLRPCNRRHPCDAGTDSGSSGSSSSGSSSSGSSSSGSGTGGGTTDAGAPPPCDGPIVISSGGTYGGCHEST